MKRLSFRARVLISLVLFALIPASALLLGGAELVRNALPVLSGRAPWEHAAATGRKAIAAARASRLTPEQEAAVAEHEQVLSNSLEQASRVGYLILASGGDRRRRRRDRDRAARAHRVAHGRASEPAAEPAAERGGGVDGADRSAGARFPKGRRDAARRSSRRCGDACGRWPRRSRPRASASSRRSGSKRFARRRGASRTSSRIRSRRSSRGREPAPRDRRRRPHDGDDRGAGNGIARGSN